MEEIKNILRETLEQVNEFRNDYLSNEQAVRTQLIDPILNVLGWKTSNPKFVRPNAIGDDGKIPDYTLLKNGKKTLIVEAKNLTIDLQDKKIIDQLANYCFQYGIDFGILTNGVKWLLFKTFEKNPKDRIIWQVDIENDKIEEVAQKLSSFSYHDIDTLDTLLKKNKVLDNAWETLIKSTECIVSIIAQKLSEKVKTIDPHLEIDLSDIKSFTKGKIIELFEFAEIEEENEKTEIEKTEYTAVEDVVFKRQKKNSAREKVSVTFPDKTIIKHSKVVETFVESIRKIGAERVLPLQIYRAGVPIVSETKDEFYNQYQVGKYWVMVHTSTKEKVAVLNEINEKLGLKLIIETFVDEK